jgi:hypothetical protein
MEGAVPTGAVATTEKEPTAAPTERAPDPTATAAPTEAAPNPTATATAPAAPTVERP